MSATACDRCGAYTRCAPATGGLLWLCPRCPLLPACGAYAHDYHGTMQAGIWVCRQCGAALTSVAISTAPVEAPAPTTWVDC